METGDPLVTAHWLVANAAAPDIKIVDATWFPPWAPRQETAHSAYDRAHIPGAVYFDIDDVSADSDLPHMLPDSVKFASRMRRLGVGDGHRVVVYDANNFFASARVWWMFRVMGHQEAFVLDGGFKAWVDAGGDTEDLPPVAMERHYTPRVRADLVKDIHQVAAAADAGHQIIDARPAGRFTGDAPEPRPDLPSGHIKGSLNVPSDALVGADGRMKDKDVLSGLFEAAGADVHSDTITTCGSGVSAAIIALAMARLGNWSASLYDGSWSEWGASGRPVETGGAA